MSLRYDMIQDYITVKGNKIFLPLKKIISSAHLV